MIESLEIPVPFTANRVEKRGNIQLEATAKPNLRAEGMVVLENLESAEKPLEFPLR